MAQPLQQRPLAQLYPRWGRQILVQGVDFKKQHEMGLWTVACTDDGTALASQAAHVAARYLVGAGIGRLVTQAGWGPSLEELDPGVHVTTDSRLIQTPDIHLFFATRTSGATVDMAMCRGDGAAPVSTLHWHRGKPAELMDSVPLGAAVADVVLADLLGLVSLPGRVDIDWTECELPKRSVRSLKIEQIPGFLSPAAILAELSENKACMDALVRWVEHQYPLESCGVVLRDGEGVLHCRPLHNVVDALQASGVALGPPSGRFGFAFGTAELDEMLYNNMKLMAIWHSHCDGPPHLSPRDQQSAAPAGEPRYPGVAWLVAAVDGGTLQTIVAYGFSREMRRFVAEVQP